MEKSEDHDFTTSRLAVTGTMVAYYHICRRKLWLFARGLNLENVSGNPDVVKGKLIHESRFQRENYRDLSFDRVQIDFIKFGDQIYLHEIKKSRKFEEAHIMQMKYYILLFKFQGCQVLCGNDPLPYRDA